MNIENMTAPTQSISSQISAAPAHEEPRASAARPPRTPQPPRTEPQGEELTITRLVGATRRQWRAMSAVVLVCVAIGLSFYASTPDTYRADARVLVDDRLSQLADQIDATPSFVRDETGFFNEVAVLNSRELALQVVRDLNLVDDPVFNAPPVSGLEQVKSRIRQVIALVKGGDTSAGSGADPSREFLEAQAADTLRSGLRVLQVGRGYSIQLSYQSHDPELATRILRSFLDAYIAAPANTNEQATDQALTWLEDRVAALDDTLGEIDAQIIEQRAQGASSSAIDALLRRRTAIEELQTSTAESYENLIVSQEAVPFSGVKVLDAPKDLKDPTGPSLPKWLIMSALIGMLLAIVIAALRELLDNKLRTAEQMIGLCPAPFLGYVPASNGIKSFGRSGPRPRAKEARRSRLMTEETFDQALSLIGSRLSVASKGHLVGLASMLDGDGKSTLASALAVRASERGLSVLVVDADRHRAGLSKQVLADSGGMEAQDHGLASMPDRVLWQSEDMRRAVLTYRSVDDEALPMPQSCGEVLDQVEYVLEEYDLIIVDMPSLVVSNEARLNVDRIDTLIFTAAFGATPRRLITKYMELRPEFADKIDGLLLNKANLRKIKTYSSGGYEDFMMRA